MRSAFMFVRITDPARLNFVSLLVVNGLRHRRIHPVMDERKTLIKKHGKSRNYHLKYL